MLNNNTFLCGREFTETFPVWQRVHLVSGGNSEVYNGYFYCPLEGAATLRQTRPLILAQVTEAVDPGTIYSNSLLEKAVFYRVVGRIK